CGCASSQCARLLPPEGATQQSIAADVNESLTAARKEASNQLVEADKAPLEGNCTKGFLRDGYPCVAYEGALITPQANQSLFVAMPSFLYLFFFPIQPDHYGPESVTDRYVLHLLERVYRWDNISD